MKRDEMIRDPFEVAQQRNMDQLPLLKQACINLGMTGSDIPLIASPAKRAKSVIDAKEGGPCSKCGQKVWLSPSSARSKYTLIVCLECVERAAGLTEEGVVQQLKLLFPDADELFLNAMLKKMGMK